MKKFIKRYSKFIVGTCVLIMALVIFAQIKPIYSLERGTLSEWPGATTKRRVIAVRVLTASNNNTMSIVKCVDYLASDSENRTMAVRDATQYCVIGAQQIIENNVQE